MNRWRAACLAVALLPLAAHAQQAPAPAPGPPIAPRPAGPPPLPTVQTPGSPLPATVPGSPAPKPAAPAQPGAPAATGAATAPGTDQQAPAAPPPAWIGRGVADLVVLDKVTARSTPISVRVGQTASVGTLTIAVRSCQVRPPDVAADATVYLDIADSHAGAPQFHGWMLLSEPSVSLLEHPIYDVRLMGCHD
jgi:hypothetical protein